MLTLRCTGRNREARITRALVHEVVRIRWTPCWRCVFEVSGHGGLPGFVGSPTTSATRR